MSTFDFASHTDTDPKAGATRAALALVVFLATISVTFIAMTELGVALIEALAAFRQSAAVAFAFVIYAPALSVLFILSVVVALWASRQAYSRPARWTLRYVLPLAILSVAVVTACGVGLASLAMPKNDVPPLAGGLYGPWRETSTAFAQRLGTRFPAGTAERTLVDELRVERFRVDPARREAVFDGDGFPCRNTWYVSWQADNGHLVAVTGSRPTPVCL